MQAAGGLLLTSEIGYEPDTGIQQRLMLSNRQATEEVHSYFLPENGQFNFFHPRRLP